MKNDCSILALSAIFSVALLAQTAVAQITFVETSPRQQRPQAQQGQRQSGLSPEKKKSLARYGPEDAFPGAREEETNQRRSNRSGARQTTSKSQPTPSPTSVPSPTLTPSTTAATTPTPAIQNPTSRASDAAGLGFNQSDQLNKSQSNKPGASSIVPIALSLATLLVFGALLYVVNILRKRLKSES